jgi:[ribosomal protein S5]-alanine N-acetyltransferase
MPMKITDEARFDWKSFPIVDAGRVRLRRINDDDVDSIYRIFSNPEVMRYWSTPPLPNKHAAILHVRGTKDAFNSQRMINWGIARRENDLLIGTCTLFNFNFGSRRAELGYALDRACWGQGFMQEALSALVDYAFDELGLHRLEADVDPRNIGSVRTVERLGFQQEGYLRQRWQVAGEIQDALFFGLLKADWLARRGNGTRL